MKSENDPTKIIDLKLTLVEVDLMTNKIDFFVNTEKVFTINGVAFSYDTGIAGATITNVEISSTIGVDFTTRLREKGLEVSDFNWLQLRGERDNAEKVAFEAVYQTNIPI